MIDVTFTINSHNWSGKLSDYDVTNAVEVADMMTAIDGTEYAISRVRPIIRASFMPLSDEESAALYEDLSDNLVDIVYSNPHTDEDDKFGEFRVASDISATFGLRSINGNRYYKGGTIVFRRKTVER